MTYCEECGRAIIELYDDETGLPVWIHDGAMWDKSTQWGDHEARPATEETR